MSQTLAKLALSFPVMPKHSRWIASRMHNLRVHVLVYLNTEIRSRFDGPKIIITKSWDRYMAGGTFMRCFDVYL